MLIQRKFMAAAVTAAVTQGILSIGPASAQASVQLCSEPMTDRILILVANPGAQPALEILPAVLPTVAGTTFKRGQTVRLDSNGSVFWTKPPVIAEDTGS